MKLHKNKESQSQQAVGYSLSFKMGTNENNHGRLWGIKPILSNKKIIFALMFVFLLIASFVYAQSTATPTGAMSEETLKVLQQQVETSLKDKDLGKVYFALSDWDKLPSGTSFNQETGLLSGDSWKINLYSLKEFEKANKFNVAFNKGGPVIDMETTRFRIGEKGRIKINEGDYNGVRVNSYLREAGTGEDILHFFKGKLEVNPVVELVGAVPGGSLLTDGGSMIMSKATE